MTKLYVANTTKQVLNFTYRALESRTNQLRQISIKPGEQKIVVDGTTDEISAIIQHHEAYGLIDSTKIDQAQQFIGTCYSIDKPVAASIIEKGIRDNDDLLDRGAHQRRQAALAAHDESQRNADNGYRGDLEFSAEQAKDQHGQDVDGALKETVSTEKGNKKK